MRGFFSNSALQRIWAYVPFTAIDLQPERATPFAGITITTTDVTGEQLIQEFIRQDPRYTAIVDGDWVVVMPTRAVADPVYPLNIVVDHLKIENASLEELASAIAGRIKKSADSDILCGRDVCFYFRLFIRTPPHSCNEFITLDLSSRTVRSLLLDGAAQNGCSLQFTVDREKRAVNIIANRMGWGAWWLGLPPEAHDILNRREKEELHLPEWQE